MHLPNFLIIGAAKSGTTSLATYLKQHPEVYLSPYKEPNYFAFAGETLPRAGPAAPEILYQLLYSQCVTDYDTYLSLFDSVRDEQAIGEASVRYLYFEEAPRRIKEKIPDVRMIAILREPVSRIYSHYCMNMQYQLEPLELPMAIEQEQARRNVNWGWDWHYVNVSLYAKQIKRYFDLFNRDQIKVFLYDDFVSKPLDVYREVCRHIGVDDRFVPDMSKKGKVAYRPRSLALDKWLHWPNPSRAFWERSLPQRVTQAGFARLKKWNGAPVPPLDADLRKQLSKLFYEDIQELEGLLERKISWFT